MKNKLILLVIAAIAVVSALAMTPAALSESNSNFIDGESESNIAGPGISSMTSICSFDKEDCFKTNEKCKNPTGGTGNIYICYGWFTDCRVCGP